MAIVMNMTWSGLTAELYDRMSEEVNFRNDPPPGGRYHVAWFTETGARIVDVWDSAEAFDEFTQTRLMPGVEALKLDGEPDVAIWQLHDLQIESEPGANCVVSDDMDEAMPLELYSALESKLAWQTEPPAGGCVHITAIDGQTTRSISIWESHAAHEAYVRDHVVPALGELAPGEDVGAISTATSPLHTVFDPTKVRAGR